MIGSEEIRQTGTAETEQLLNALPQAVAGSGAQSNAGNGSATVNLRNLGAARTLVLQNGRRIVGASQDGVVDINMIPPSLIERVEVVTGGASAVYGSDGPRPTCRPRCAASWMVSGGRWRRAISMRWMPARGTPAPTGRATASSWRRWPRSRPATRR
ncbi:TonB-dependent receptor plug domain-containing protein [Escherichia coli]|uniref:TonB-dependent receptor plug domain-containing protein n=1 Tax=Escherichia coli TaxID=562 RepID=UPI0013F68939|nr:TonB-dependent receptor plug domain-containing protein [Escherichia coli]